MRAIRYTAAMRSHKLKPVLWILGLLLIGDVLYFIYAHVLDPRHVFGNGYVAELESAGYSVLFGIVVLVLFAITLGLIVWFRD